VVQPAPDVIRDLSAFSLPSSAAPTERPTVRYDAAMADQEPDTLYDTDVAAWAEQQAGALRRRAANEIDWDNVAEEIEGVAASRNAKSAPGSGSFASIC
jgi:hypothetical protein